MGGVVGFDYVALARLADDLAVETPPAFWKKVRAVEVVMARAQRKQQERTAARKAQQRRR